MQIDDLRRRMSWDSYAESLDGYWESWDAYSKGREKDINWPLPLDLRLKRAYDDSVIRKQSGKTIWVAFDLLSLTSWAQMHPCMAELRRMSRFCKDGENELARLLRPPTMEEKEMTCLNWPPELMDDFKVDGEFRSITII